MSLVNLLSHFQSLDWIVLLIPEQVNIKTYHYDFEYGYFDYLNRFVDCWFLEKDALGDLTLHVNLCEK